MHIVTWAGAYAYLILQCVPMLLVASSLFFLAQVEYVKGWGKLKGADEVEVALLEGGSTTLKAANVIIATGSEVAPLPGIEIDEER